METATNAQNRRFVSCSVTIFDYTSDKLVFIGIPSSSEKCEEVALWKTTKNSSSILVILFRKKPCMFRSVFLSFFLFAKKIGIYVHPYAWKSLLALIVLQLKSFSSRNEISVKEHPNTVTWTCCVSFASGLPVRILRDQFPVSEIEAAEACKWLRATGFPQYAQMYEGKKDFIWTSEIKSLHCIFYQICNFLWTYPLLLKIIPGWNLTYWIRCSEGYKYWTTVYISTNRE